MWIRGLNRSMRRTAGAQLSLNQQAFAVMRKYAMALIGPAPTLGNVFTDSLGTTPATAIGDLMGLVLDRMGTVGSERVTNGDFSAGSTGWSVGGGWSIGAGVATATAASGSLLALGTGSTNKTNRVEFDIPTYTSGTLYVRVGAGTPVTFTSAGHKTVHLVSASAASVEFYGGAFTGSIDNISVKELTGSNATQPTGNFKPSLTRVPKRLGPNVFVDANAVLTGESTKVSPGVYRIYTSAGVYSGVSLLPSPGGKSYEVTFNTDAVTTAGGGLALDPGSVPIAATTGAKRLVLFDVVTSMTLKRASGVATDIQVSNVVIREVLEWSYAMSFGGDDFLNMASINTGEAGWICAGVTFGAPLANKETVFANGAGSAALKGVWLLRLAGESATSALRMGVGNGTSLTMVTAPNIGNLLGTPRVVEGGWTANSVMAGVDGQVNSVARTGNAAPAPNPALIGAYLSGFHHLGGPMTYQVISPVMPTDAERGIVRNWLKSLQA